MDLENWINLSSEANAGPNLLKLPPKHFSGLLLSSAVTDTPLFPPAIYSMVQRFYNWNFFLMSGLDLPCCCFNSIILYHVPRSKGKQIIPFLFEAIWRHLELPQLPCFSLNGTIKVLPGSGLSLPPPLHCPSSRVKHNWHWWNLGLQVKHKLLI